MTWPLGLDGAGALGAGLLIGIAFGFFLERGGLGEPKKLTGLFYLRDFTMLKVMFTAIAVAAGGVAVLAVAGLLDLEGLAIQPTYLWPQVVGGAILGAGFVIGGY
ncbi:MAG: YeeE/YedE family protein [Candidatus Rokubacteria bacterium]|nr:YeeE/YedE family protein [Candidatus Rokubacteria bacterium]